MENQRRCWSEVNIGNLIHNYETLKTMSGRSRRLMAIVKANAYGCGALPVAKALEKYSDDWLGVACLEEALELRKAGIKKPILVLGYTPPQAACAMCDNQITATVLSQEHGELLEKFAKQENRVLDVHVKLDSGMLRLGQYCYGPNLNETFQNIINIYSSNYLSVSGIFTHFSSAYDQDEESQKYTNLQYKRFSTFCNKLLDSGLDIGLKHCCNSAATVNYQEYSMDMCRVGTVLYGLLPTSVIANRHIVFRPVISLNATVVMVKYAQAGEPVSYSREACLEKPTKIAVISCGYADGYRRGLSGIGRVLIRGEYCHILGRICMDLLMVDANNIDDVAVGDEVILLGKQGANSIECQELYRPLKTGPSEITTSFTDRVERIYL